ncbi:Scr1 family TA system antitoxin-like transcriptional regulator [Actinomadura bangladeshensis]
MTGVKSCPAPKSHPPLDGPFTILDGARGSSAYMEANAGGRLTHDPTGLDDFERRFYLIGSAAASASASRAHIAQIMEAKQ